jgi:hypothetical protein
VSCCREWRELCDGMMWRVAATGNQKSTLKSGASVNGCENLNWIELTVAGVLNSGSMWARQIL